MLTHDGVDAYLDIDKSWDDKIPADALAVVGNRSAVGEQYVDLQPQTDNGPYLHDGSQIAPADTRIPLPTQKLLGDMSTTVESVNQGVAAHHRPRARAAFAGTGPDLQRIIDTGTSFIRTANRNFDVTTALIRDGNTVLTGQVASASAIRSFARDLRLFSGTLAGHDRDLRRVIDNGSVTATQLRTFLEDNRVDLADLINNLVTTGDIVVKHLPGIRQILVVYPYVVEGGFTVVSKSPETGLYDAHFGLVLTNDPTVCHSGYQSTDTRLPQDGSNRPMNVNARCTEPASQSDARGAQHAPANRPGAAYRAPVAAYDPTTGRLTWGDHAEPHTHGPGEPRPGHAWRGVMEMATATAPDAPVEVTPEEPTPEEATGHPRRPGSGAVLLGAARGRPGGLRRLASTSAPAARSGRSAARPPTRPRPTARR